MTQTKIAHDAIGQRGSPVGPGSGWVFSRKEDLWVFGGSSLLSMALLTLGITLGWDQQPVSPALFLFSVVFVDVAHVWSTVFRTYLDRASFRRHRSFYLAVPVIAYALSVALYSEGPHVFWRALAYLAVWHFIRQQAGFMKLARAQNDTTSVRIDQAAVFLSALVPVLYWHAHLPRAFDWFIDGDFAEVGPAAPYLFVVGCVLLVCALVAYVYQHIRYRQQAWGKHLILLVTLISWWSAIVWFDSDYAFTVMNVLPHGLPYLYLLTRYTRDRAHEQTSGLRWWRHFTAAKVLALVWLVAFFEEVLWDRTHWHDHAALFGTAVSLPTTAELWWVPLLALPQLTHYILDGFVWRRNFDPWRPIARRP